MDKNISYKKFQPQIERVEHSHFFHSHDMKGRALLYSNSVGGHYHACKFRWDLPEVEIEVPQVDGSVRIYKGPPIEVGPAVRTIQKKLKNGGVKTIVERVRYATGDDDEDENGQPVQKFHSDMHTHVASYRGSEEISPDKLNARKQAERAQIAAAIITDRPADPGENGTTVENGAGKTDIGNGVTIDEA
jgi:hypothetical protein